jgi:two-component system nitrate/nitrite response regulator NarL
MRDRSETDLGLGDAQDTAVLPDLTVEDLFHKILEHVEQAPISDQSPDPNESAAEVVLETFLNGVHYTLSRSRIQAPQSPIRLSPREKEIIRLVSSGFTNKSIAAVLEISPWTVATHLRRVFAKLGVNSRAEMITKVLVQSLLEAE